MEADPDCKAAIDILSFALYHENNQAIGDGVGTGSGPTTININEDDNKKRKRGSSVSFDDADNSQQEVMRRIKEKIWDQLSKSEGELSIEEVCKDIDDRGLVMKALSEIELDERIMIAEGVVFQI